MPIAGINWVAVLAAAAAFFAIGFVIHMRLVELKAWDAAKHVDQAKLSKTRMACGMVLPLATAVGLALLFSWGNVTGVAEGIKWGLVVALVSGLPVVWYNWFYGTDLDIRGRHRPSVDRPCRRRRDPGWLAIACV